jgi:hypothetical protein
MLGTNALTKSINHGNNVEEFEKLFPEKKNETMGVYKS